MEYDYHEALKLTNQLCFPLYAASRSVVNLYTPYLKPLGLTYTQYIVLLVLWEKDGITVGEICDRLMLDNGTLSPLLKKMQQGGYLHAGVLFPDRLHAAPPPSDSSSGSILLFPRQNHKRK